MATALAAQLQALANSTHADRRSAAKKRTRPSILFDAREAAEIDNSTIFSLALSGLEELLSENVQFEKFKQTLFSVESSQTERELQGQEFNAKLDASIRSFLCLLGDFLLLSAAHQTLEYLIRRYKIHVYNVDDLIKFTLPYHETSLFVRVVQLSNVEKTRWRFLEGVKKSGAAPPRKLLVQQCLCDMAVLEGICELGAVASQSKTSYSFSAAVVMEALDGLQEVDSSFLNRILPYIIQSFEKSDIEEAEVGGLMIVGSLTNKATLSEETISLLFNLITKIFSNKPRLIHGGKLLEMAVMVLVQVIQTQSVTGFPEKVFKLISKLRDLPNILKTISASFVVEKAVRLFLLKLANNCFQSPEYSQLLRELFITIPLREHVECLTVELLQACALSINSDFMNDKSKTDEIKKLFLAIKDSFPDELDTTINQFFECSGNLTDVQKDFMCSFLNSNFEGSLHSILPETNQSIYRSLQHSEANIRATALQKVAAIAKSNSEMKIICRETLLVGLQDNDLTVIRAVLTLDNLTSIIDSEELLIGLSSVLRRCMELLENGSSSTKGMAKQVGKSCLELLSTKYLEARPYDTERVGYIFLNNMLLFPKTWKLNVIAVKLAKNVKWNLFKRLSTLDEKDLELDDNNEKESRKVWLHQINAKVINVLADSMREDTEVLKWNFDTYSTDHDHAKSLFLLVLLQVLSRGREGITLDDLKKWLGFLRLEWIAIESSDGFSVSEINSEDISREDFFTYEFYKKLQRELELAFASLVVSCLYRLLVAIPVQEKGSKKDGIGILCMLEDLFVIFSSSHSRQAFEKHVLILVNRLPVSPLIFLSSFFNAEGGTVPWSVQVHSLVVLLSHWNHINDVKEIDLKVAIPSLLVSLGNPVKAVRKAGCRCLKKVFSLLTLKGSEGEDSLMKFLELVSEVEGSFVSNGEFLPMFLSFTLGSSSGKKDEENKNNSTTRLKESSKVSVFLYLLRNALGLPSYTQYMLLVALMGAGRMQDQVAETRHKLEGLLCSWTKWKIEGMNDKGMPKADQDLFRHLLKVHLHVDGVFTIEHSAWFSTVMTILNVEQDKDDIDADMVETFSIVLNSFNKSIFSKLDSSSQDAIFEKLIHLCMLNADAVYTVSHSALQKISVHASVLKRYINKHLDWLTGSQIKINKDLSVVVRGMTIVMEFILSNDKTRYMHELVPCLYMALQCFTKLNASESTHIQNRDISYLQTIILEVIENIVSFDMDGGPKAFLSDGKDVDFLVEFIHGSTDVNLLNQALSLLATLGKVSPDLVLEHVISVFSVLGEKTLIQVDNHSYLVTEKLLCAVVPSWLQKNNNPRSLLEILVKSLPQIPVHRRSPLLRTTLRVMNESSSLHILLLLLLEKTITSTSSDTKELKRLRDNQIKATANSELSKWCGEFCSHFFEEYELLIRLGALLNMLKYIEESFPLEEIKGINAERGVMFGLHVKMISFICNQLQRIENSSDLSSSENLPVLKDTFVKMLETVLSLVHKLGLTSLSKKKKRITDYHSLEENSGQLLESITKLLSADTFTDCMTSLLKSEKSNIKIKALHLISTKLSTRVVQKEKLKGKKAVNSASDLGVLVSEQTLPAFERLVGSILSLVSESQNSNSLELNYAAVSAFYSCSQALADKIPPVFVSSLPCLIKNSQLDVSLAPMSLQCITSIIHHTGPSILPALNEVLQGILTTAKMHKVDNELSDSIKGIDVHVSVLEFFEASVQKVGTFLSPYLQEILTLLVLEPCYYTCFQKSLNDKAKSARCCLAKTIPARLLINPLVNVYDLSLHAREESILACIEMFTIMVSLFDKPAVNAYSTRIFELCLNAFDIRRKPPQSLSSVTLVETNIISLFTVLVLKLSEKTFKPLFVKVLEWAEIELPDAPDSIDKKNIHRSIVFYRIVNHLADKLRSVFVPYFQYLLKGCIQLLGCNEDKETTKVRKKSKVSDTKPRKEKANGISGAEWHLRYLIVSSLHKCFLYDTIGFLDSNKFQMLLSPLVEQMTLDRPSTEGLSEWVPSSEDMHDTMVSCLGQMAVTSASDLLWKPLNHEVLLQSRNESARVRLLSLDIVKYLVDHLKEDYLALLPETIPFLAELLEDQEVQVVTKSQEIIKVLEDLSGESLAQYL